MQSFKPHFQRFLSTDDERLHFAAHSHHLWPDVAYDAHCQAWLDAATHIDAKWQDVFGRVIPSVQAAIAKRLSLPDPETLVFAPNTHEFVLRLHSLLEGRAKIVTTDGEFHSFKRQAQRWEEAGQAELQVVPVEPFESFGERFLDAVRHSGAQLVYLSQVFFNSGYVAPCLTELAELARQEDFYLVVDGYHGFMALPTDLSGISDRAFYIAGGYKYAMSGEGACFMHCPPGLGLRPVNTGWFAGFGSLEAGVAEIGYADGGMRFAGSTFDVSGLYRFNAVQSWLDELGVSVEDIHGRVVDLQEQFLVGLAERKIDLGELVPPKSEATRGHFLTFRSDRAGALYDKLAAAKVVVDYRGDRLRFGFGLYHDPADVDALLGRLISI